MDCKMTVEGLLLQIKPSGIKINVHIYFTHSLRNTTFVLLILSGEKMIYFSTRIYDSTVFSTFSYSLGWQKFSFVPRFCSRCIMNGSWSIGCNWDVLWRLNDAKEKWCTTFTLGCPWTSKLLNVLLDGGVDFVTRNFIDKLKKISCHETLHCCKCYRYWFSIRRVYTCSSTAYKLLIKSTLIKTSKLSAMRWGNNSSERLGRVHFPLTRKKEKYEKMDGKW